MQSTAGQADPSTTKLYDRWGYRPETSASFIADGDVGADVACVKDWLGHGTIHNTTIYTRLTATTLDALARKNFSHHRIANEGERSIHVW